MAHSPGDYPFKNDFLNTAKIIVLGYAGPKQSSFTEGEYP